MEGHMFTNLEDLQLSEPQSKEEFQLVIASCPNLTYLVFAIGDWEESDRDDGTGSTPKVLPALRTLLVCQVGFCGPCRSPFLDHITAPRLLELGLPASRHQRAGDSLQRFLQRSQCSLVALYIHNPITNHTNANAQRGSNHLLHLFTMTPGVETLHVVMESSRLRSDEVSGIHRLWEQLQDGTVLPELKNVIICIGHWEQDTLAPAEADKAADEFLGVVAGRVGTGEGAKSLRSAKLLMALERDWGSIEEWNWKIDALREEQRQQLIGRSLKVLDILPQRSPVGSGWGWGI
ncbi:hypothetical protein AAF712_013751 [Marasmius tenuissimus]|uniref:Uncharacterized protein n=1 Tax=Marasmius tenuissimus TaxID=585030 RepID=A0ABR2ZD13_9AGAR